MVHNKEMEKSARKSPDPATPSDATQPAVENRLDMRAEAAVAESYPNHAKPDWRSVSISAAFHLLVLAALVLLGFRADVGGGSPDVRRVSLVLQTLNDQNEIDYLTEQDIQPDANQSNSTPPESSAPPETLDPLEPLDSSSLPAFELPSLDAPGMTQTPSSDQKRSQTFELTEAQKEMIAADQTRFAAEANRGAEATLSVFGSGTMTGRNFVFVIDRSKSMGGQGLGVLDLASRHLSEAIDQLQPNHRFQIVAYHRTTTMIDDRGLLNATPENKQKVKTFVNSLAAFGSTYHDSALFLACSLRPDVIVLISDGGLPYLNRAQLDNIRRAAGRAQIHCLEFGQGPRQSRGGFMEILASDNNGSYRYIDVSELRKNN